MPEINEKLKFGWTKANWMMSLLVMVCLPSSAAAVTDSPMMVKDIRGGSSSSDPIKLTNVNGTLFFGADDGVHGMELWRSDGTEAGTVMVKNINPKDLYTGGIGSNFRNFTNVNGTLFFRATNGFSGRELWRSDGTEAGTVMVKDIREGSSSSDEISSISDPITLTNVNGTLFFSADDGIHGEELWRSDGTEAGTVMVKDISDGSSSSSPDRLTNVNGTLFFGADDGVHGMELWRSDGTEAGTVMVKDIFVGRSSSFPNDLTNVNGTLFFSADDDVHGYELWRSDGTEAGTVVVKDIREGSWSSFPNMLTNVNGALFFRADDDVHGRELWRSNGTEAGTVMVKDIRGGSSSSDPFQLTNVNGTLFFRADDGVHGMELWRSDCTAAGTVMVKDINPIKDLNAGGFGSSLLNFTNVNGTLIFSATNGFSGTELWRSNGTEAGTVMVKDIREGSSSSSPYKLTNVNGTLFFSADDGVHGRELWALRLGGLAPQFQSQNPCISTGIAHQ